MSQDKTSEEEEATMNTVQVAKVKHLKGEATMVRFERPGYQGPSTLIYRDGPWVWVETDPYSRAMVNLEAVPEIIRALQAIQRQARKEIAA